MKHGAISSAAVPARPLRFALGLVLASLWLEGQACDPLAGQLIAVEGKVELRPAGGGSWAPATLRQGLCPGDQLAVRGPGRAAVVLHQNVLVRLDQNTTLTLPPSVSSGELGLSSGVVHVISRFNKRFGILTPFVNALVDGTEFTVASDGQKARVVVAEGRVRTQNEAGEVVLGAGEGSETRAGAAPGSINVRPLDAAAWAIHYPQLLRLSQGQKAALPEPLRARLVVAEGEAAKGHFRAALEAIDGLAETETRPELAALKASYLLAIGQVESALGLIGRFSEPDGALSTVRTVIHVARNETGAAKASALQALALDRRSAAPHLAYSYALQADRQLSAALAAAVRATDIAPDDPIAWARRAELELGLGRTGAGGESASRALDLAPDTPRARAMLAFSRLLAGQVQGAADEFSVALALNDADPMAHFGLGLTFMRQGRIEDGRREVEIAALLDPSNAELRSYLGRAYMEEERSKVAGAQFDLARRLDPASPTPWYFDAFRLLQAREPLAAVRSGEQALLLNDNRAALRGTELIDQDRAARSASLGAAYLQVGFAGPALSRALAAVSDDAQSAAAHRLLADAYAETPRFETARISELLQAQLRQPIGQWPLPPQFVMPALPILDGPRTLSPDESTAFFDRRPDRFAASLMVGNQSTQAGSVLASHAGERYQLSFGAFDYRSEGLAKDRDDTRLSGMRVNYQLALAPSTMLLAEARHSERVGGDLTQTLFESSPDSAKRLMNSVATDLGRVGLRHAISNNEELLAEVSTQRIRERIRDRYHLDIIPGLLSYDTDTDFGLSLHANALSLLYSLEGEGSSFQAGSSAFHLSGDRKASISTCCDVGFGPYLLSLPSEAVRNDRDTVFGYATWRPDRALSVLGGAEYVRLDDGPSRSTERVNGKIGLIARLGADSTARGALFQGVSGSKYDKESLAPTQFAGFNQVFDDVSGTRWRRAAVAFDQGFGGGSRGGVEVSRRWLSIPALGCLEDGCLTDWDEALHRVHLAIPFGNRLAFSAEWRHEYSKLAHGGSELRGLPNRLRTELLPLRLWAKAGPGDLLLETWGVRQEADIDFNGSSQQGRSGFSVTNLSYSAPLAGRRLLATLGVHNLFDRQFRFQNTDLNGDPRVPLFYPQRTVLLQGQLRF